MTEPNNESFVPTSDVEDSDVAMTSSESPDSSDFSFPVYQNPLAAAARESSAVIARIAASTSLMPVVTSSVRRSLMADIRRAEEARGSEDSDDETWLEKEKDDAAKPKSAFQEAEESLLREGRLKGMAPRSREWVDAVRQELLARQTARSEAKPAVDNGGDAVSGRKRGVDGSVKLDLDSSGNGSSSAPVPEGNGQGAGRRAEGLNELSNVASDVDIAELLLGLQRTNQ